jgi:hypothetical protein
MLCRASFSLEPDIAVACPPHCRPRFARRGRRQVADQRGVPDPLLDVGMIPEGSKQMIQKGSRPISESPLSKFGQRERCLDGRKLNWPNALDYPCRPLNALKSIVIYEFRRRPDSAYALRCRREEPNSSTKTAEAPVYDYAKRPRTRAANRLNRLDTTIGETKPNFLNDYMEVRCVGVH